MNVVIIEDEMPAYKRLLKTLRETEPAVNILTHVDSVTEAHTWFSENPAPDLVFLDIHLADGSGFDLLAKTDLKCPVIFTTAYDQYAMDAFKTKSIDYLLKPVKKEELRIALDKLQELKNILGSTEKNTAPSAKDYKKRFVIRFGEHIKTLQTEDIAYCYSENKVTFAKNFEGRIFPMDYNLDALEHILDPQHFFRINRQYLINLKAIEEMKTYTKARVIIKLQPAVKESPVVSSERAADFKLWLDGEL